MRMPRPKTLKRMILYAIALPAIAFMVITYSNLAEACDSTLDYAQLGFAALSQQEFNQAIDQYSCAISQHPNLADNYIYRGIAHRSLLMNQNAVSDLTFGISLQPVDIELAIGAYTQRGNIYYEREAYAQAIADYTAVVDLAPRVIDGYQLRALAYYDAGQFQNAISDFSQILRFSPNDSDALFYRGVSYYSLAQYEPAIADITRYITYDHRSSQAYTYAGNIYFVTGNMVDALNHYSTAVNLDGQNLSAAWGLANAHYALGNQAFALGAYRTYITLAQDLNLTPEDSAFTRIAELEN